jgi:hypothetical protein
VIALFSRIGCHKNERKEFFLEYAGELRIIVDKIICSLQETI